MNGRPPPTDAEVRDILVERLDAEHDGASLVVGIVSAEGRQIVAHSAASFADVMTPGSDTLFEIGSNTKVFTALLLAEMAARGEVGLDDPAAVFLPPGATLPERNGRRITLRHLAAHVSGLPRDADNYAPKDPANPFADFTVEGLYGFLGRYRLDRDPGAAYAYSNVGAGLLGHLLALRARSTFEALVRERISLPLGLVDTTIALTPAQAQRGARGHNHAGQPTPWLEMPAIPGAGALRSTANDLLTFLGAILGPTSTPLSDAMRAQLAARVPAGRPNGDQQALGWLISHREGHEIAWHVGRTIGGHGFIGADLSRRIGVVVLGNMGALRAGDDIGFHILAGAPLAPPPVKRRAVRLAPEQLERLAGRYRLSPTVDLVVSRIAGYLRIDIGGRASHAFIPESETTFFVRHFDAQVTFELGEDGFAAALVTHQDGRAQRAPRLT
ncbi:MAG TPA: serine hydrolase [Caulobacteraceae bacterium]|nr:serine hydrolase [Caulobacteraceae bacterium]